MQYQEIVYHEITLSKGKLVIETFFLGISSCSFNLIVVVVEADYVASGELDNFSCWATNTASNIQDIHIRLDTHAVCKIMFVPGNCLPEGLTVCKTAEME
jgi:hypothetical protein